MLQSALFRITCTRTFILRRSNVESVAQGEGDAAGVVVLHLAEHHAIAIEREAIDASIEEVIAWELDVKATFAEVLADTKRKDRICTVEIGIRAGVTMSVHIEVCLHKPVVRQGDYVA